MRCGTGDLTAPVDLAQESDPVSELRCIDHERSIPYLQRTRTVWFISVKGRGNASRDPRFGEAIREHAPAAVMLPIYSSGILSRL